MTLRLTFSVLGALILSTGCGGGGSTTAGATETGTTAASATTEATSTTTAATTTAGSATSTAGSISDSATTAPTTGPQTSETTEGDTTSPSTGAVTATTGASSDTSGSSDTSSSSDGGSSTGGGGSTGGGSSTGPMCVPAQEVCNDLDDDCNGIVDDVDAGGDGICDCLNIALFGNKGSNPASQFETWLKAQGTQVDRIQTVNMPIDQPTLDKYDIIILDRLIRTYNPQEAALIEAWVSAGGGGLMSMTGYTGGPNDVNFPNSILGPMGLTYNNSMGIINGPVTNWVPHPVSDMITSVTFLGGFYINIMNDGVGINTVVATLPQGPVAVAQVRKAGKVFVWGDEWIEFDSEWQNIPQIKKFWANILGWLSPMNFCTIPM